MKKRKASDEPMDSITFYRSWLSQETNISFGAEEDQNPLIVSDLFCGPGGFSFGFIRGVRSAGIQAMSGIGVDYEPAALATFKANNNPQAIRRLDLEDAIECSLEIAAEKLNAGTVVRIADMFLEHKLRSSDVLLCSPPCRGFSQFNNSTRFNDPKNKLLISGMSLAIASGVDTFIMENVIGITHDSNSVLETAVDILGKFGYSVDSVILKGEKLGLPQSRKRLFLIASRSFDAKVMTGYLRDIDMDPVPSSEALSAGAQNAWDSTEKPFMDTPSSLSQENRERIQYMFEHDLTELPNHMRPDCHKDGHTYPSVYGRIKGDEVSGTLTTGFLSIGRGRFMHPFEKRGLTPREGARLQSFPDHYQFHCDSANTIASRMIGDAVAPIMSYWIGRAYAQSRLSNSELSEPEVELLSSS